MFKNKQLKLPLIQFDQPFHPVILYENYLIRIVINIVMPQVLVRKCASRISCSCLFTETFLPRSQVFWHVIRFYVHLLLKEYFLPRSARQIHFFHCYKHVFRHQMFQFYKSFHPHKNVLLILCVSSILFCVRVRLSIG